LAVAGERLRRLEQRPLGTTNPAADNRLLKPLMPQVWI
jgi:hypothetical protein